MEERAEQEMGCSRKKSHTGDGQMRDISESLPVHTRDYCSELLPWD